jgi:hypothetical protein
MKHLLILILLSFAGSLAHNEALHLQDKKPAAKPNFSGTWKVNIEKSTFGPSPTPKSLTYKIEHKDSSLKLTSTRVDDGPEDSVVLTFTTDGQESTNVVHNSEVKSKITWEGAVLVIDSVSTIEGGTFGLNDKWTLSEDGKTINWVRLYSSSEGSADAKYLLEKQ